MLPRNFADLHRPLGRYFRVRRLRRFLDIFRPDASTTVLDVGGAEYYWQWCDAPVRITIVNSERRDLRRERLDWILADGRNLPFADRSFDIVYCNSVMEHLPDQASRRKMAAEIARVGRGYCVQTPNRWFPVEPHTLAPGFQFLPKRWQARLARNFTPWGWLQRPGREESRGFVSSIRLMTAGELQSLFPDASIERERFLGLTKSVSAIRKQGG